MGETADPALFPRAAGPLAGRFASDWRPALVTALVAAATFAVTLGGTFIYDDLPIILDDPRMSDPSLWRSFWLDGYRVGGIDRLYRPLTSMSFAVQRWMHGGLAWPFHLVNVLLHAGARPPWRSSPGVSGTPAPPGWPACCSPSTLCMSRRSRGSWDALSCSAPWPPSRDCACSCAARSRAIACSAFSGASSLPF